jgi:hypothetical protein
MSGDSSASGDQFTIKIGGDSSGPVVAGNENRIEIHQPAPAIPDAGSEERPDAADTDGDEDQAASSGSAQTNTANDHGTVYSVMHGDLHIHRDDPT